MILKREERYKILQMEIIASIDGASHLLCRFLEARGEKVLAVLYKNKMRHRYIITKYKENIVRKYYLMFKKEYYKSFQFEFENDEGYADSINEEWIDFAIDNNVAVLIFCYGNGYMYEIDPIEFKQKAFTNGWVREQDGEDIRVVNGQQVAMKETTYSLPLRLLNRLNPTH